MNNRKHTLEELQMRQALPLSLKIRMTEERIREWINYYGEDGVYISFSGGKDSTVLLDIVRKAYPNVKAMFVDIPTQYPELRQFVKTFDNVDIVKPKMNFFQVCEKYGFPLFSKEICECVEGARRYLKDILNEQNVITDINAIGTEELEKLASLLDERMKKRTGGSNQRLAIMLGMLTENGEVKANMPNKERSKFSLEAYKFLLQAPFEISNRCCSVMKKEPSKRYSKKTGRMAITAQMASESKLRTQVWLRTGCNAFNAKTPISNPMSFWTEQDVLRYIKDRSLPICSVYGQVVSDDEEMGQMQLADYEGMELFDIGNQPLHCTGCDRTGCVLCGFGAHLHNSDRFVNLKKTHSGLYSLMDVAQNNGYTMRQAIDWIADYSDKIIKY